jgi:hypothetical protein
VVLRLKVSAEEVKHPSALVSSKVQVVLAKQVQLQEHLAELLWEVINNLMF